MDDLSEQWQSCGVTKSFNIYMSEGGKFMGNVYMGKCIFNEFYIKITIKIYSQTDTNA